MFLYNPEVFRFHVGLFFLVLRQECRASPSHHPATSFRDGEHTETDAPRTDAEPPNRGRPVRHTTCRSEGAPGSTKVGEMTMTHFCSCPVCTSYRVLNTRCLGMDPKESEPSPSSSLFTFVALVRVDRTDDRLRAEFAGVPGRAASLGAKLPPSTRTVVGTCAPSAELSGQRWGW